ncbi:hypothetical protein [Mycobacterium sp. NPDC050853]|uniref:hypothetical protein n=1 Tax=Mycobacterium sp. NPDC050853 TaxID=3155160 RepID=UPI0033DBE710
MDADVIVVGAGLAGLVASPDAIDALIAGKRLNLILMGGDDLRAIARDDIAIDTAIRAKLV